MSQITLAIPPVSALRTEAADYKQIPAGVELHRVHHWDYPGDLYNDYDGGDARFSPIRDSAGHIIPTIYAAASFQCAVCEIVLRAPEQMLVDPRTGTINKAVVAPSDYDEHQYSRVVLNSDLKLLDLSTIGQRKIGVDRNALIAGSDVTYVTTRAWAEAIYDNFPEIDGLHYVSHQTGEDVMMLFGTRAAGAFRVLETVNLNTYPITQAIKKLARSLGMKYVDP